MLRVQRYGGQINSVHYSPDSTLLAFTVNDEKDKTVRIVNGETGALVRSLSGHGGMVNYAAFSPDGRRIASASSDKTLNLWDAATGRELRTLSGHTEAVLSVAFSADGKRLVSGSADLSIRIWDAETGREIKAIPKTGRSYSVAFSPDGTAIASAFPVGTFSLWDIAAGTVKVRNGEGESAVYYSMFSSDGKYLIAGQGNKVKIRAASNGVRVRDLDGFTGGVNAALYSPDGTWIAAACGDGTVRLLDTADYSPWFTFIGFTGEEWLTLLPQNYYYGSANGDRHLSARLGNTVSGADRYRQNLKPAALALGMRVSMDLTVQRFLEPNNRAAISRVEGRLQSIVSSSAGTAAQVSRAEIETGIGAYIAGVVEAESWEEVEKVKRTVELVNITHMFTSFFLSPNQNTFNVLKSFKKIFDDTAVQYAAIDYATAASKSFADQGDKERAAQMQTAARKGQQNITAFNNSLGLPQDTRLDISGQVFDRVVNNLCPALADRLR
jgi:Tol biopolymer transport system component